MATQVEELQKENVTRDAIWEDKKRDALTPTGTLQDYLGLGFYSLYYCFVMTDDFLFRDLLFSIRFSSRLK
jgi:hypothetical protein